MLDSAAGDVDVAIHRQKILTDLHLEFDGEMPCFPPDVQGALSGYEEKMSGRNLLRTQGVFESLAPGDDADARNQYDEPTYVYLIETHGKSPQFSCLQSRGRKTCLLFMQSWGYFSIRPRTDATRLPI